MKKQVIYICLILFAIIGISSSVIPEAVSKEKSCWFPFVLAERMNPDSPANIGKLVLDAPAGKHGFVTVKDGHFYFENGTRAKFWGTNLCFSACFPSKKNAEIIADRLAFFGFNAVRFHHMDSTFEPRGIFEDICPAYKHPQAKQTGHLSQTQLDKLDYFIYQLKQRGIYVDINLLVSRHFTEADGIKDAEKLGMAAKLVSMFDPKLIELQKKYAKDLLTHYNPYTKLRYCDDPVIALIEITNENSIVRLKNKSIPEYYQKELDELLKLWLKKKYGSDETAQKAWFPNTGSLLPEIAKWNTEQHQGAKVVKTVNPEDEVTLDIKKITDVSWHLQYRYNGAHLTKGKSYLLKFTARADRRLPISVVSQQAYEPWKNLGLGESFQLEKEFKTFEVPFIANSDCENAKVGFIIGNAKGIITLKNVSFFESNKARDIKKSYAYLETKYYAKMRDFLKNEIGIKTPIGIGGHWNPESFKLQNALDYIDTHAYWDHPHFPHKKWDMNDFRIHNKSMLKDKNLGIIGSIKQRANYLCVSASLNLCPSVSKKPFTITEWNHCYPNQYAYETPVLLAAEAVKNDWDALFQFAFSHGWKFNPNYSNLHSYFDIIANPQKLILCSLGSLIFHNSNTSLRESPEGATEAISNIQNGIFKFNTPQIKGIAGFIKNKTYTLQPITITSNQDGAIFLYSPENKSIQESNKLILVTVSGVKNKNSGWKNGRFNWGTPPTMLNKINVKVSLSANKDFKIYEINPNGTKGRQIETRIENNILTFSTEESSSPWFVITYDEL